MKVEFLTSFARDLRKVRDKSLLQRVHGSIEQVEGASTAEDISQLRKLRGSDRYYRICLGDYRLGIVIEGETVTFVQFLHRKDIYRYCP